MYALIRVLCVGVINWWPWRRTTCLTRLLLGNGRHIFKCCPTRYKSFHVPIDIFRTSPSIRNYGLEHQPIYGPFIRLSSFKSFHSTYIQSTKPNSLIHHSNAHKESCFSFSTHRCIRKHVFSWRGGVRETKFYLRNVDRSEPSNIPLSTLHWLSHNNWLYSVARSILAY